MIPIKILPENITFYFILKIDTSPNSKFSVQVCSEAFEWLFIFRSLVKI